ncbi:hypothetical protein OG225_23475 [Nocardia sp. NBC_01377]|uniref:hypothetical protein n=1 Tax=Nocardia sp. NBC_01377 TaxID=2903595 RepID=UPI00324CFCDD
MMHALPQRIPGSHAYPNSKVERPPLELLVRTVDALTKWAANDSQQSGVPMVAIDEHWLDCSHDPDQLTDQSAKLILSFHKHSTWQPCLPQLAALAYLSNPDAHDYE